MKLEKTFTLSDFLTTNNASFLTAMLVGAVLQSTLLEKDFTPKLAINPWKLSFTLGHLRRPPGGPKASYIF